MVLDDFFKIINVSETTQKKYSKWYNKIISSALTDSIFNIDKNTLIDIAILVGGKSKIDVLSFITNIYSKLRQDEDLTIFKNKLAEWRKVRLDNQPSKNKEEISVITYEELNKLLNTSLKTIKPESNKAKYVVALYILFHFNVRNKDLIITYIKKKEFEQLPDKEKSNKNYIFFDKDKLYYLRNDYKTAGQYGSKAHVFTNRFIKQYLKKNKEIKINFPIFINKSNSDYYNANNIQRLTTDILNELTDNNDKYINQQILYKIIVNHYTNKNNFKKLKTISNNRGQDMNTQSKYYSTMK